MMRVGAFAMLMLGSTAGLKLKEKPQPVLKLRGGDTLTNVGAGLFGLSGAMAYIAPKANFENYKMTVTESTALANMRGAGAWQMALGAIIALDPTNVHAISSFLAAAAILIGVPAFEVMAGPKAPSVIWMGILSVLGKFALDGKVSPWVAVGLYLANGLQFYFTPKGTAKMYKVPVVISPMGYSMFSLQGSAMIVAGIYLGCLAYGLTAPQSFGAAFLANAVMAAKWAFTEAEALGAPKEGPLAWAAISTVLGGLALK
jgi:hypothetical protein